MAELTPAEVESLRVSMRDYIDLQVEALDKRIDTRIIALEDKIDTFNRMLETRLQVMNEFRSAMNDQTRNFITRAELQVWKEHIEAEVEVLKEFRTTLAAKADQKSLSLAFIVLVITLAISIVSFMLGLIDRIQGI